MKKMIALLLLSLGGCSHIETRIEHLTIPKDHINCPELPPTVVPESAFQAANIGNWKPIADAHAATILRNERLHNKCVRNMNAIATYQSKVTKDKE